jgi:hypothetical protein
MVVAIHQPNFFPWLGYFDKMAKSDVFVFLDSVQAPKGGGSWLNRVKIAMNGKAHWVTAPIDRDYRGVRRVDEITFAATSWREQVLKTMVSAYGRAPGYGETMPLLEPLVRNPASNVAAFNDAAVRALAAALRLDSRTFVRSSELELAGHSNDLLVAITRAVGGHTYLCGGGAQEYFDETPFHQAGLSVQYQNFTHPSYPQGSTGDMITGLSVVDALMHCGADGVARLLQ